MKLVPINAGFFKLDGGAMHGVVPKSMWQKVHPSDDNNMCTWAMRCLYIEHDGRKILIDTGMGDKQDEKFKSHFHPHGQDSLLGNLNKHGINPEDITDVFLTHLHFDHCGGAIKREGDQLIPTFPNATYWSNKEHWAWSINPNEREKASFLTENIMPIQESGQLKFIEGEQWIPVIDIIYVKGHTEQMMLPLINFNGQKILFCADLFPSAAHISLPWIMSYDVRPLDTLSEKKYVLKRAVEENWWLFYEHDAQIVCSEVLATEKGIRMGKQIEL